MSGSPLSFEPLAVVHGPLPLPAPRRAVAIVVPVYRGAAQVQACVDSVLASLALNRTMARMIVIDDASPEPALSGWLDAQETVALVADELGAVAARARETLATLEEKDAISHDLVVQIVSGLEKHLWMLRAQTR